MKINIVLDLPKLEPDVCNVRTTELNFDKKQSCKDFEHSSTKEFEENGLNAKNKIFIGKIMATFPAVSLAQLSVVRQSP